MCTVVNCAYSTELSGERITGYFMEYAKKKLGKDWEGICKMNRSRFYSMLLKAKDELCTRHYDSTLLELSSFTELDDVQLSQDEFFASFRDKLPLEEKLRKLIEKATEGEQFSRLFFCGSASRHVLVRDALERIAKEMGFRTSEVMNADEAVVSGLVFSQLPRNNPSAYASTKLIGAKIAVNVDTDAVIFIENPKRVNPIPIDENYDKRFQHIQNGDKQMEDASREYLNQNTDIRESTKE